MGSLLVDNCSGDEEQDEGQNFQQERAVGGEGGRGQQAGLRVAGREPVTAATTSALEHPAVTAAREQRRMAVIDTWMADMRGLSSAVVRAEAAQQVGARVFTMGCMVVSTLAVINMWVANICGLSSAVVSKLGVCVYSVGCMVVLTLAVV